MSKKDKWLVIKRKEITFFFKYDNDAPELLHIYARHLTNVGQALYVWFEGTSTVENRKYKRFETSSSTHCLYWTWMNESEKKVMIISCFKRSFEDE